EPSEMSVAVRVCVPDVLSVTLAVRVPADNDPFTGMVALGSLEVMPTVCVLLTRFQFASTDLTVTLKAVPAPRAVGVPILPVAVPGAAVSPGTSSCSFTKVPAFTVTFALVLDVSAAAASVAVIVLVPAVLKVKLDRVPVPATNDRCPTVPPLSSAITAAVSVLVKVTLGVALEATFQLASTALTTMPLAIAVPAVCGVGAAAVLPAAVPGAATSPGNRICSLVTAPGLIVIGGLV